MTPNTPATARIRIDHARCEGYAFCERAAPELFHATDVTRLLTGGKITDAHEGLAQYAIQVCPVGAIQWFRPPARHPDAGPGPGTR
jgi:ferredoxin